MKNKYLVLFVLLLVSLGIGLFLLHVLHEKQSEIVGDRFYEFMFKGEDIKHLLDEKSNWSYLAKFDHAARNPVSQESISVYASLADTLEAPDVLRELAQYFEILNSFSKGKVNSKRLKSSEIFPYSIKEAIAVAKIQNGDVKNAVEVLHSLLESKECPDSIKMFTRELLEIYESSDIISSQ